MVSVRKFVATGAGMLFATSLLYAAPAAAQATRTWVSGVGDDVNPCSRTAPCKTFAGAISKTAAGGEINCLDQGAYGTVTITKSISIICEGVTAGVLHSATNGIIVNAAATDRVYIKGLDINGAPPSAPGLNGIRFLAGASLTVENSLLRNAIGASPNGNGIIFAPSGAAQLNLKNVTIETTGAGSGIEIAPATGGSARATIKNTRVIGSANIGIRLNTTNGGVVAVLDEVEIAGGAQGLVVLAPTNTGEAMVVNSTIANNSANGILAAGAAARVRVANTTITANAGGVNAVSGSAINSYGNNRLNGNTNDGTFTLPAIAQQ